MIQTCSEQLVGGIFITFSGNCEKALRFYKTCFGGRVKFETIEISYEGRTVMPVVIGSLVSDRLKILGSDLVHGEGRKVGNYIAIYFPCTNREERNAVLRKLGLGKNELLFSGDDQKLVEVTDVFNVTWILGI